MRPAASECDAYGTLCDVQSAVKRHAGRIGPDGPTLSEVWRLKQLEYAWVRTLAGAYADFWQLTGQALDFALAKLPSIDSQLREDLLEAYWTLECYPEVRGVLEALKAAGARLAILSNGSPAMLEAAVNSAAIDALLDDIFSVDAVGRFKTDPAAYEMVTAAWGVNADSVSFQSSNRWDIAGATKFGFRTVWINRSGQPDEYPDLPPSAVLPTLDGLLAGA